MIKPLGEIPAKSLTAKNYKKGIDIVLHLMYNKKAVGPIAKSVDWQNGSLAQLGEHLPYKQRVTGSSPVVPTTWLRSSVG